MSEPLWTLDELADRVDAALAVDYEGQPSGRVRKIPDRRAIRWYTTIGLIDRPAAHRGRTAMYGQRHLLQLVAVKRLQARGLPLVAIQQELAGATEAQLNRVARLPGPEPAPDPRMARPASFWRKRPAATFAGAEAATAEPVTGSEIRAGEAPLRDAPVRGAAPVETAPARESPVGAADGVTTLRGVRLGERATLLIDPARPLDQADLRAILDAARPLLDALRARGLDPDPGREHP